MGGLKNFLYELYLAPVVELWVWIKTGKPPHEQWRGTEEKIEDKLKRARQWLERYEQELIELQARDAFFKETKIAAYEAIIDEIKSEIAEMEKKRQ